MTLEETKALSDEQRRVKVAELLGWHDCRTVYEQLMEDDFRSGTGERYGERIEHIGGIPPVYADEGIKRYEKLPNYTRDLNACHEMEQTLEGKQFFHYYAVLAQLCMDNDVPHFASAPAYLRCTAFMLTMEGI